MKLLIIGSDKIFAIENFYAKYLKEENIEVLNFPAQSIFYDFYQKNIFNKLLYKIGVSTIYNRINKKFKQNINFFKPDAILVFKGMEIYPESLQWAKQQGVKLINYNPDNPFLFSGKGSGNNNLKVSIPMYDLHLTYNPDVKKEMEKVYKIPKAILPFGFDINNVLLKKAIAQKEMIKACFLGNPDVYRGKFLEQLAMAGILLDVYGGVVGAWHELVQLQPLRGEEWHRRERCAG